MKALALEGLKRRNEAMERVRDQLSRQQAHRDELAAARQLLIAVSLHLNTGDLPSELHDMLDDYVELLQRDTGAADGGSSDAKQERH